MVFNMGWGCVVCGLACSTSSGFSSGLFSVGVFGLRFPFCVCVCVCVCVLARARGLAYLVFLQERKNILNECEKM